MLGAEVEAELHELMRLVPDPDADPAAVEAVGWLYWVRYRELPDGPERYTAMMAAGALLSRLYRATPEKIPHELRLPAPDDPGSLTRRAVELTLRFEAEGDVAALDESVRLYRRALATMSTDDPHLGLCCQMLSTALRYGGDPGVLPESVELARAALSVTPADHEYRADRLSNLGHAHLAVFDHGGDADALWEAVACFGQAVAASDDHPHAASLLVDLSRALQKTYRHHGDVPALLEAVRVARRAAAAPPDGRADTADLLSHLGVDLQTAHEQRGDDPALVPEALRAGREALAVAPPDHPHRHMFLGNLSTALRMSHEQTGDIETLLEALEIGREAVTAAPADSPDRAAYQSNLAGVLATWSELRGDVNALEDAVRLGREAVAATPPEHTGRLPRLNNLALALHSLYLRNRDVDLLAEAVQVGRQAVVSAPPDHPGRARTLLNLGVVLESLADRTKEAGVMAEAVGAFRESVAAARRAGLPLDIHLNSLCVALRTSFEHTGNTDILREAVQVGKAAATAVPGNTAHRARALLNLASSAQRLAEEDGSTDARSDARTAFEEVTTLLAAPVQLRITAWWGLGRTCTTAEEALGAYEQAVELLQQVAPRALAHQDRVHVLSETHQLPAEAASVAIAAGRPDRAVALLERARGTLLAEAVGARHDLRELHDRAPSLADEFDRLRAALDDPESADATQRHRLGGEWESLLDRVRALPGFHGFLRTPPVEALRRDDGPVVLLNLSRQRCDALVITPAAGPPVRLVPLPDAEPRRVRAEIGRFLLAADAFVDPDRPLADKLTAAADVRDVLAWTWDAIAGPVLDALGLARPPGPGADWPRVWWCPVGPVAYLPLHAAGRHTGPDALSVMDCVVSSYTPTANALSRDGTPATATAGTGTPAKALVVAMPETPRAAPLPGALAEAGLVAEFVPGSSLLIGPDATRDAVLAALPRHGLVHLACHGHSDWNARADSRLLLHDHADNPLTIGALSRLRLPDAELAYLAACSTTRAHPSVVDEAVHITAAFRIAGYRHVVARCGPSTTRSPPGPPGRCTRRSPTTGAAHPTPPTRRTPCTARSGGSATATRATPCSGQRTSTSGRDGAHRAGAESLPVARRPRRTSRRRHPHTAPNPRPGPEGHRAPRPASTTEGL
ncbi:tetratricopeptide repeat protein [Saccharothrix saharensis]|uniref:Tetratricopeptide repeat protein n=1 Tax=Saccharothrix saharensis TaxID=571190 RepID=A0A543JNY9_9PSEU|nr:tetratricopeptide repeat protein [Saccharothrix saharensis]